MGCLSRKGFTMLWIVLQIKELRSCFRPRTECGQCEPTSDGRQTLVCKQRVLGELVCGHLWVFCKGSQQMHHCSCVSCLLSVVLLHFHSSFLMLVHFKSWYHIPLKHDKLGVDAPRWCRMLANVLAPSASAEMRCNTAVRDSQTWWPCIGHPWKFTGCIQFRFSCPMSKGSPAEVDSLPRRLWNVNTAFFKIAINPSSRAAFGFAMVGAHRSCYRPGSLWRATCNDRGTHTQIQVDGRTDGWIDRYCRWKMDMQ